MSVILVNRHRYRPLPGQKVVYIGRGTPLGNEVGKGLPRPLAIQVFREFAPNDDGVLEALADIVDMSNRGGEVVLMCSCKPLPCHGDVLLEMIEGYI